MAGRLDGKVAVVTGGASGIGKATVERFVSEGAQVVFCDLPAGEDEQLIERLGPVKASVHHRGRRVGGPYDGSAIADRLGKSAHFVAADVTNRAQLEAVLEAAVEQYGGLDIMFNNAGVCGLEGKIMDCPEELFDRTIDVDLKAVWYGIKLAARLIVERGGGSIISTASVSAISGMPGLGAYSSAKGGVVALTRVAAVELASQRVRVNCICPGNTVTGIAVATFGASFNQEAARAAYAGSQPLQRAGEADDMANAALWLASDDSSFVTGQMITVDGGATAEYSPWMRDQPITVVENDVDSSVS